MSHLQFFEADGGDWRYIITRTMFSVRQEARLSTRRAGGLGRLWITRGRFWDSLRILQGIDRESAGND